jgi:hypothetical protein
VANRQVWWVIAAIAGVVALSQLGGHAQQSGDVARATFNAPDAPSTAEMNSGNGYINSDGNWTRSPVYSASGPPAGSTARCADGTYSFSQHRRGTCSYHGGVAAWN